MRLLKLDQLVLDMGLYPRTHIDPLHVTHLKHALQAGVKLPPIVIDQKSRRIADGFHRHAAYLELNNGDYRVDVIEKRYKNDAELLADAIRLNASHGRMLSRFDRLHCLLLAEATGLSAGDTAEALGMTVESLGTLRSQRIGTAMTATGEREIALKRTIAHMGGQMLNEGQMLANQRLSGHAQGFYVQQLIMLIDNNLIDLTNQNLMDRLEQLSARLTTLMHQVGEQPAEPIVVTQ